MKILSSFTHSHVVPNQSFFLLLNTKEDTLKNVGNQTVDSSHRLHMEKKYYRGAWKFVISLEWSFHSKNKGV